MISVREFFGGLGMVGCAILLVVAVFFGAGALYVVYLNTLGVATQNAQRQVIQQSLPYIQAHQQQLETYYANYQTADAGHQPAYQQLICQQAPLLDRSQWPPQIESFFSQHCQ